MTSQDGHEVSSGSRDVEPSNPWQPKLIIAGTVCGTSAFLTAGLVFCILTCRRFVRSKRIARQRKLRRRLRSPLTVSTAHSTAGSNSLHHHSSPTSHIPGDMSLPLPPDMTSRNAAIPAWWTQPTKLTFELPAASVREERRQLTHGAMQFDDSSSSSSRLQRPTDVLDESDQYPLPLLFTEEGRRYKGLARPEAEGKRDDEWRYVRQLQRDSDDVTDVVCADQQSRLRSAVSGSDRHSNPSYQEHNTWELTHQSQRFIGHHSSLTSDVTVRSRLSPESELQEAEPVWIRRTSRNGAILPAKKSAHGRRRGRVEPRTLSGTDADCKRLHEQFQRSDDISGRHEDSNRLRVKHSARLWSTRS